MATMTLEQLHEAGRNLRTQLKSLYDVLEVIDEIKSLGDLKNEAEAATAKAKEDLGVAVAEWERATASIESVEGKVAKLFQDAANGRAALREEAEAEAKKIREAAKAFLSKAQDEEGQARGRLEIVNNEIKAAEEYRVGLYEAAKEEEAKLERIREAIRALASS